jgi:hypothetical protein
MNLTRLFEVQEILRGTWCELIRLKSEEDFLAYIDTNNLRRIWIHVALVKNHRLYVNVVLTSVLKELVKRWKFF